MMWTDIINKKENQVRLGAGQKADPDVTNVDIRKMENIDIVHNLLEFPWPIEDNQFDVIVARDVVEHIPPMRGECWNEDETKMQRDDLLVLFMEQIYRIALPEAHVLLKFPHPAEKHQFGDPTHYRLLSPAAFTHFCPSHGRWKKSIYTKAKFEMCMNDHINNNYRVILKVIK